MILSLVASAFAQDATGGETPGLNAQSFRPTVTPTHFLWTDEVGVASDPRFAASTLVSYTNDPLVYEFADGTTSGLVTDVLQASVLAGGNYGPARFGLDLPVYLFQSGAEEQTAGLGDVGLDGRISPVDREAAPVGLSFGGRLVLPTSTAANALANGRVGYELTATVDGDVGPALLALNLGTTGGPEVRLQDVTLDDAFLVRGGAMGRVDDLTGVGLETSAELPYSAPLGAPGTATWEWMATGYRKVGDWQLRGGFGSGLTNGVGAPDFRLVFGAGWNLPGEEPPPPIGDTDLDGLLDNVDGCPAIPEDADGWEDGDGCPDTDDDADGIVDTSDSCPRDPEDPDRVRDEDGCPEPEVEVRLRVVDAAGGGLVDTGRLKVSGGDTSALGAAEHRFELVPGTYRVEASAAGYDPATSDLVVAEALAMDLPLKVTETSKIVVTRDRIELKESVLFETNSAKIKPASDELLSQVAKVLADYPEIALLHVGGHTDSRGPDEYNLKLSNDRAASVRQWLVDHGIAESRITSQGYGETQPVDPRENSEAWAKNRRVEMTVAEWKAQPTE